MVKGKWNYLILAVFTLGIAAYAEAGEPAGKAGQLPEIVVTGERITTPTRETGETVYTGTEVTKTGIAAQGTPASTSVYEALNLIPGISVESADPYGLAAEQRTIRVRGVRGYLGSLSVEGVPNYGGNPIGPRDYLYDTENFQAISVYKGAVPADLGVGIGSRGGAIELKPLWPEKNLGLKLNQSLGTDNYQRTFLRFDSGSLTKMDTRLSASYSYADADKWKGPGTLGPRNNVNLALSQPFGSIVYVKLWFNYNDLRQNLYRSLTYAQTQNLDATRKTDFNETLTGVKAQDTSYFDYNRGDCLNKDFLGLITITPSEQLHFSLKPYVSKEDTQIYQGVASGGGTIQKRTRDIDRQGVIAEAGWDVPSFKTVVGYHFENSDMNIYTQNYNPLGLVYQGYGVTGTTGGAYIHSPYLKIAGTWQKLDWQAGVKYFRFEDSASEGYKTPAPLYNWVRDPSLDREARTYDIVLPSAGVAYKLSDYLQVYSSYGKNFIRPYSYLPLVNLYSANKTAFTGQGIVLNDLFKGYDIEESDNIDLGLRIKKEWFDLAPTVFYGKHKNLLTTIYDQRVNLNYQQNLGKATGYGFDLETNIYLHRDLTLFINPTYTVLRYDDDLTYAGATLKARDNQVVDTPEIMVKAGLIYKWGAMEVIPSVNFIGTRYADVEHREEVSSYAVTNLKLSYTFKKIPVAEALKLSCELNNIFDRRYISGINSSDDTRAGTTSYMVGAPFSAVVSATINF